MDVWYFSPDPIKYAEMDENFRFLLILMPMSKYIDELLYITKHNSATLWNAKFWKIEFEFCFSWVFIAIPRALNGGASFELSSLSSEG